MLKKHVKKLIRLVYEKSVKMIVKIFFVVVTVTSIF